MLQAFTLVKHTTGTGKDAKSEFTFLGSSLIEAQQLLTEATIAYAQAQAQQKAKEEATNVQQQKNDSRDAKGPQKTQ